jgi:DNA-binding response OmpR family regulator
MNPSILLIEDNVEMCENIAEILRLAHYEVLTASNGKEGVALASSRKPSLILCDIMMPELDGYGVLHILSRQTDTADIPFIFLTAKAEKDDFRTGMNLGADDYITKPIEGLDLLNVVEVRLRKNKGPQQLIRDEPPAGLQALLGQVRQMKSFQEALEKQPPHQYKKKDFIYQEGQMPNAFFLIEQGEVKTYKTSREGKELITGLYAEGSFFGYIPLFASAAYADSAVVQTPELLMHSIARTDFLQLVYSNCEIARQFIRLLSSHISEKEERLLELAYQSVRQRVAGVLLKMHEQGASLQQDATMITASRKDLSALIGTATESLNRTLADFKEEGLIALQEQGIRLLDLPGLQRIHQ